MRVVPGTDAHIDIRLWAKDVSPNSATMRQLEKLAAQPYVVDFVAAMADVHLSDGVAVGSVFATEREVVPRALGGDLGCGMRATRLGFPAAPLERQALERWVDLVGLAVPSGDRTHDERTAREAERRLPDHLHKCPLSTRALEHVRDRLGTRHLGTLGGGNHFIELDRDAEGAVWLLVHSGSRGMGAAVAAHHARAAGENDDPFASLRTDDATGAAYVADLTWALDFARANRDALAERARALAADVLGLEGEPDDPIDVPHNFVARETWRGRALWVHRKGAIAAGAGRLALVPGSMGTASYIVEGLGADASFASCSHGAGRVFSRKEAHAKISPARFASSMRDVAIPRRRARSLIEEAPAAYRDIVDVLRQQEDLVKKRVRLEPIAVFKG